jgi:hypothetical protein
MILSQRSNGGMRIFGTARKQRCGEKAAQEQGAEADRLVQLDGGEMRKNN